jgi:anti-sigma factor RsiW
MSEGLKHIFNKDAQVSDEEMLNYLNNRLSPAERAELEQRMASSELFTDAEEGLQLLQHKENVPQLVNQINRRLVDQLRKKRHTPAKPAPSLTLVLITTLLLLLLIVLAYLVLLNMK